jgi:choline monooxygenase
LRRAPRAEAEPEFHLGDFPLLAIRAEAVGPFVFANLDPAAPPAQSCYGQVLDIIRKSGVDLDAIHLHSRNDWQARANWKAMLENYLECYHCAVAHPGFSAAIDVRPDVYTLASHGWFSSQAGRVRPAALEGKAKMELYDVRGEVAESQYHFLWPNLTININPGFPNLSVDVWLPDGPNATRGFSEQFFGPGVDEDFAQALIAFNKQVAHEDDELTDSVQRGLVGGLPERGRFLTSSEQLVIHFQKMVVRALTGSSPI